MTGMSPKEIYHELPLVHGMAYRDLFMQSSGVDLMPVKGPGSFASKLGGALN